MMERHKFLSNRFLVSRCVYAFFGVVFKRNTAAARPRIMTAVAIPTPAASAVELLLGLGLVSEVEDEDDWASEGEEDRVADCNVFVVIAAPDSLLIVVVYTLFVEEAVEEVVVIDEVVVAVFDGVCEEPIMEVNTASSIFHPFLCSPCTSSVELTVKLVGW